MTSAEIQTRLGALRPLIAAAKGAEQEALHREREALKLALAVALAVERDEKEARKREEQARHFAGIGSPLHAAIVARFPADVVRELEDAAVAKQLERDAAAAARRERAAKVAASPPEKPKPAPPPPPKAVAPPRRNGPEVYVMTPRSPKAGTAA